MADMQKTRRLLGAAILLPLIAGCGSDGDSSEGGMFEAGTDGGKGETTSSGAREPAPAEVDFSGLISLGLNLGSTAPGQLLSVTDPRDPGGDPVEEITVPGDVKPSRSSFSADWQYTAWFDDMAEVIRVARLDPAKRAYVKAYTIRPAKSSYSRAALEYDNPRFSPDGKTLWFEAHTEEGDITFASVQYADYDEGDRPQLSDLTMEDASGVAADDWWTFDESGDPVATFEEGQRQIGEAGSDALVAGYWTGRDGSIADVEIKATTDPDSHAYHPYDVIERLGPSQFLVAARSYSMTFGGENAAHKYGVVARATIDPSAETLELKPMVPIGAGGLPEWVKVSPDGDEALLCVDEQRSDRGLPYLASLRPDAPEPKRMGPASCPPANLGWF